jgi:hypothetical protein
MAKKKPRAKTRTIELELALRVLAVDSNYEPVTKAAFDYRQAKVYPYLESKGFTLIRCQGLLARRIYVAPEARRTDVVYITGVGHGSYTTYTGDHYDAVFEVGQYHSDEAAEKIVHLLSCQTAAELGPDFVQDGCRAYLGYDENFTFYMAFADTFFECDSEIDRGFADGLTADEVYQRVIALFNQRIADLENAGHDYVASVLEYDRDHLMAPSVDARWGDPAAQIA